MSEDYSVFTIKDKLKEFFFEQFDSKVFQYAYSLAINMDFEINFSTEEYHDIFIILGIENEQNYEYGDMMSYEDIETFKDIILNHYGNKHVIEITDGVETDLGLFKDVGCVTEANKWSFSGCNDVGVELITINEVYELYLIDIIPSLSIVK